MGEAKRDNNRVTTLLGVLDTDGETPIRVTANPSSNALVVDDDITGSDNGTANAKRDNNSVPAMMAVSSSDGATPVTLYINSSGELLVDSS